MAKIATVSAIEYKKLKTFEIIYGIMESPFGNCMLGLHNNQLCFCAFFDSATGPQSLSDMKKTFPNATLIKNDDKIKELGSKMFQEPENVDILLKGTAFQTNVWKELRNLKKGSTNSYESVAIALKNPNAIRAAARAVAANKIGYFVPCHRVISKTGGLGKYKWGSERKMQILQSEEAV